MVVGGVCTGNAAGCEPQAPCSMQMTTMVRIPQGCIPGGADHALCVLIPPSFPTSQCAHWVPSGSTHCCGGIVDPFTGEIVQSNQWTRNVYCSELFGALFQFYDSWPHVGAGGPVTPTWLGEVFLQAHCTACPEYP